MLDDLTRLPDEQREALLLSTLGDLSQQEIGATLNVRTEKVKALVFQARQALGGWKEARATDCAEIQEQLATVRGAALRHTRIQRHVAVCAAVRGVQARGRAPAHRARPAASRDPERRAQAQHPLRGPLRPRRRRDGGGRRRRGGTASGVGAGATGAAASGIGASLVGGGGSGLAVKAVAATLAIGAGGGGVVAVGEPGPSRAQEAARAPARTPVGAVCSRGEDGPVRSALGRADAVVGFARSFK